MTGASDSEDDKVLSEPVAPPEPPKWDGMTRLATKCECWICARKILTLFFWSKKIGLQIRKKTPILQSQHRDQYAHALAEGLSDSIEKQADLMSDCSSLAPTELEV